jgi:hypothetical protein
MDFVTLGFIISTLSVGILLALFRYEEKRGVRVLEHVRTRADFSVLKTAHAVHTNIEFFSKVFLKQVSRSIFHTILFLMLKFFERCERGLRNIMRTNKTLARSAERENMTLSKLEEIALHKAEVALSEEEKQAHREKVLNGM